MNSELAMLINQGFFKSARKELMQKMLNLSGFNCYILNNELFLENEEFCLIVDDFSSTLMGDDSKLRDFIKKVKEKSYEMARVAILKKKSLLKNDADYFINYYLNPLILECFMDFKLDFSKVAKNLSGKDFKSTFSNNFFSISYKNTYYSLMLDKNLSIKDIDYSVDFFKLKDDELFIGFPYCVKFLKETYKKFVYNGDLNEFRIIANALIDEVSKQFI